MLADLYDHLQLLDEVQLSSVIVGCVEFCRQQLNGDFSPLVQVLQVKNYRITGGQVHGFSFQVKVTFK